MSSFSLLVALIMLPSKMSVILQMASKFSPCANTSTISRECCWPQSADHTIYLLMSSCSLLAANMMLPLRMCVNLQMASRSPPCSTIPGNPQHTHLLLLLRPFS